METLTNLLCDERVTGYDNPVILPSSSISICSAAGCDGKPGMRMLSPKRGMINPAPDANSILLW
ncbi:MAG TPA: hypothetical protein VNT20_22030 [Flavisolibacter sp.]|nr:hypothetical protein [Flavisolibacter sp.]